MCTKSCIEFGKRNIKEADVKGKYVIEVGSSDINGSLRPIVESLGPASYIGIDLQAGPSVDQICKAEELISRFGTNKFDLLICTELLEHVMNWQKVIHNIKQVIKPNGLLVITTRSKGTAYHSHPFDFWRYEILDISKIFSDFNIDIVEKDPLFPGVFIKARKPVDFTENNLTKYNLYSIISKERTSIKKIYYRYYFIYKARVFLSAILADPLKSYIKKIFRVGKL